MHQTDLSWPRYLAISVPVLTGILLFLRPGASETLGGWMLGGFWLVHVVLALTILQLAQICVAHLPGAPRFRAVVHVLLGGLLGALAFTPVALELDRLFGVADATDDAGEPLLLGLVTEFGGLAGPVVLIWLGLNATRLVKIGETKRAGNSVENRATEASLSFWSKVPNVIGRELVALSAELHYLRVVTTQGNALILYPFGRAVEELEPQLGGIQIHRSHWVVLAHVTGIESEGGSRLCRLDTGLALPVAKRRRQDLHRALDARG